MVRVKICGCRTPEQALTAAQAGADFIGLNFVPQSRRWVSAEEASDIVRALGAPLRDIELTSPPSLFRAPGDDLRAWYEHGAGALERLLERKRPLTVGVFANQDAEEINEIVDECGIDLVQLSGGEPWGHCLLVNRQVIKVLHLGAAEEPAAALGRVETGTALALLLDRQEAGAMGGTGKTLDWDLAAKLGASMPVWLAGGLTPENVLSAIETVRPWAVDVSSGVETDGVKDLAKIRAFVAAVKGEGR
jgi:phosphoribosylanthranilate isomerase